MDEADLLISYSCAADLREIASDHLPAQTQSYLMSATLSTEVNQLKQLVLHSPAVLRLRQVESQLDNLKQHSIMYVRTTS
jgi:ATP-dependent RNA helicase DDX56/DBP9